MNNKKSEKYLITDESVATANACDTKHEANSSLKNFNSSEWLTSIEAAKLLKISIGTLMNMVSSRRIPYYKLGRSNRYLASELMNLLLKSRKGEKF